MYINKQGSTRIVLVLSKYVIKIPTILNYELFLCGLLANIREGYIYKETRRNDLARVCYYNRLGLFLIMERVDICSNDEAYELYKYVYDKYKDDELMLDDFKTSNWGRKNGKLVKVDYGC